MKKRLLLFSLSISLIISGYSQDQLSLFKLPEKPMKAVSSNDTIMPPTGLNATVTNNDVLLTWSPPNDGPGEWFSYSDSTTYTLIGLTDGGTWKAAAKWDPGQLEGFDGETISKVEFLPGSNSAVYTLKVWQGELAENLVYQQQISAVDSMVWNEINLEGSFEIDANSELWVGFEINQGADLYPLGVDFGPAVIGYGDLLQTDSLEWISLTNFGLDYNWNIRAFVTSSQNPSSQDKEVLLTQTSRETLNSPTGYLVYRNDLLLTENPVNQLQYQDDNLSNGFYTYSVTAVYDTLESEPASVDVQIGGPELNIVPDSLLVTIQSDSAAQVEVLLSNSGGDLLQWETSSQPDWLNIFPDEGEIQAGNSSNLILNIEANDLLAGVYDGVVEFTTNNINNPVSYLSVSLIVTGDASLSLSADSLFFENIVLGETSTRQLFLQNTGSDDLLVTSITSTTENFTIDESEFYLTPGEFGVVDISYSPIEIGNDFGTLIINSNDPLQAITEVYLLGNGTPAPPLNFQATAEGNVVNLSWLNPSGGPGTWMFYGDESIYTAIGLTDGGVFQIASRWEADQLSDYAGESLVKTKFYFFAGVAEYTLKIWEVDSLPELVYSQYLGLIEDSSAWNEVFLDEPFLIDGETELLIGYEINQEPNAFPAGVDAGPSVFGYGDLINFEGNGWQNLADYGLDYNWSIQAFVSGEEGPVLMPENKPSKQIYHDHQLSQKTIQPGIEKSATEMSDFIGYNLYRNDIQVNESILSETFYTDTIANPGTYLYTLTAVYDIGESSPAGPVTVVIDSVNFQLPSTWVMVETNIHHTIEIPDNIIFHDENDLKPDDFVGVFFNNENELILAGMLHWKSKTVDLYAYGDHSLTPAKDGFLEGDDLIWKIYRPQEDKEYLAEAVYDQAMPDNTGNFSEDGNSRLLALKINALDIENPRYFDKLVVYPNPAKNQLQVVGVPENGTIKLFASDGQLIKENRSAGSLVKFEIYGLKSGIYLIVVSDNSNTFTKKVVVE